MNRDAVRFSNAAGQSLHGFLHWPLTEPRAFVLFAHCFTCTANIRAAVAIARALNQEGFAVLSFDFTGLGESEGDFSETNFSTNVSDLLAAAEYLEGEHQPPEVLVGHSLGGTAVLAAAPAIASAKAVATIGAPARAAHVAHLLGESRDTVERSGAATVNIGGRPFLVKKQFLQDLEQHRLPEDLKGLRRALLVMHAPLDRIVDIENAAEIFSHARHPKSFISLDDADHLLSDERDARYAATVLAGWASRYLGEETRKLDRDDDQEGSVVASTTATGFLTDIDAAGHALLADEPVAAGGTDEGPSPYGLLSAALASCTSMTLQMYARHKGISLRRATTRVRHSRMHARDCEECERQDGRIDQFTREIELEGELDEGARERLLEIAERCPVHRTLRSEVRIITTLED
jgi:putative redox protein